MKKVWKRKVLEKPGKTCSVLKSLSKVNRNLFITSRFYDIWPEHILSIKCEMILNYPVFRRQMDFFLIEAVYCIGLLSLHSLKKRIDTLLFPVSWDDRLLETIHFKDPLSCFCCSCWDLLKTPRQSVEEKLLIIQKFTELTFFIISI